MKKLNRLIWCFIIVSLACNNALAQQCNKEPAYFLRDLCIVDGSVGWAVGVPHCDPKSHQYKGTILKTASGGSRWTAQESGVVETFNGLSCINKNKAWVAGKNGKILHTKDGGGSWKNQPINTSDEIRNLTFIDDNYGWATSFKIIYSDPFGDDYRASIWHTINGGTTWVKQNIPANAAILHSILFLNRNIGWAVGTKCTDCTTGPWASSEYAGVVFHTKDGGKTWSELWSPNLDIIFTEVDFVDSNYGWVVGFKGNSGIDGGTIFHTSDGGKTWVRQEKVVNGWGFPGYPHYPGGMAHEILRDVKFIDRNRGYVLGFDYGHGTAPIYRTLDGGETWDYMVGHSTTFWGYAALYGLSVNEHKFLAVGNNFLISSSDPWGERTFDPPLLKIKEIEFGNMNTIPVFQLLLLDDK